MSVIPFNVTLDAAGYTATDITLPPGKTKDDVVSVPMDIGTALDGGWNFAYGSVDYEPVTPGFCRIGVHGSPGAYYTGRVICTD